MTELQSGHLANRKPHQLGGPGSKESSRKAPAHVDVSETTMDAQATGQEWGDTDELGGHLCKTQGPPCWNNTLNPS